MFDWTWTSDSLTTRMHSPAQYTDRAGSTNLVTASYMVAELVDLSPYVLLKKKIKIKIKNSI